jgi:SAM-dependent methyltransferase
MADEHLTIQQSTCPVCDSQDIEVFIEIPQVPVYCNVLYSTREDALNVPRADMRLGFCQVCGHIYNFAFDPDKLDYTQDYENSLHHSPRFQIYARSLAARLIERHNLYNKEIIDIGCGGGDFLRLLCDLGGNRGVGFEPSSAPDRFSDTNDNQITFIKDFYSEHYSNYKADFICCRHVLEHIQFPLDFLLTIRDAIGKRQSSIVVFFEVPNAMFTLRDLSIWDLIYEHPSYFSISSLARVFISSGFKVNQISEGFEGQYLHIDAFPNGDQTNSKDNKLYESENMQELMLSFSDRYNDMLEQWQRDLRTMIHQGKRVLVWGAGSKGVTFLNNLRVENQIEYVVDANPRKHGMYVAGTGQKIVPSEFLKDHQPDMVIVMNPIYFEEIQRIVRKMNLSPDLISA